jgi:hypothetical protein
MYLTHLLLSTAATVQPVVPATCSTTHSNPSVLQNLAVVEMQAPSVEEAKDEAPKQPDNGSAHDKGLFEIAGSGGLSSGGEVLGYTRLRLDYTPCATDDPRSYAKESRGSLERFLVGKVDNHVLKFDAAVEPIGVKASSQLYSMLRSSKKDGQSWTTDVRNDDYLLPYFRLDTASVLNFSANFQSEGSSEVGVGSALLDIVERGSKFIAPSATLITDENKPRFNDAASFVDESLSKLFYKKVTETARQGLRIEPNATADQHLARILLVAPNPTRTFITNEYPGRVIGQWDVWAEKLRKSLFATVKPDGKADVSRLDPASVLNFKIGDKEVLRDRLAASEAIGKATKELAKAAAKENAGAKDIDGPAIYLCRLVAGEAARVGLAPYDLAIVAWAFLADQALDKTKHGVATQACTALTHFPGS